jgi:hypothetical protein
MRRVLKSAFLVAAMAFVWAPTPAHADGYVSPWAGVNFGYNDIVRTCTTSTCANSFGWGVDAGWMGKGIIGGEVDFGWQPDVYGNTVDNHVWDFMGNLIVGIPIGGQHGAGIRPYVTGGLGAIHTKIVGGSAASSLDNSDFGYNLGAGANGYFSDHLGIRGDLRFFRTVNADINTTNAAVGLGQFHFWRASVGLVIR